MIVCLTTPMWLQHGGVVVEEAALGSPQARVALAVLVLERRRAVPRDELADAVWPTALPSSWQGALRGLLSKVRAAMTAAGLPPTDVLTSAFSCYQLHLPPDTVVDVEAALSSVSAAEAALAAGDADAALERALAARGVAARPFLPGQGGEWVQRVRAEQRRALLAAMEVLSEAHGRRGQAGAAVAVAEEAVALDPFRESAHRRLMAAHARSGSRAEALRAYERCRRLLADELGVAPSAETEAAYVGLLGSEPDREAESRSPSLRPALPESSRRVGLVGREDERHQLAESWTRARAGRRQVALVTGGAGMGKTGLIVDWARAAAADAGIALYGRCDREVWTPYQPFTEALGRYAAACEPEELRQRAGWGAAELARLLPELADRLGLPPSPAPSAEGERHRLFSAVASFLARAAAADPVVLVVDDVHWAGPGALLLLRHLVHALEAAPLLVVATYRPEEAEANQALVDVLADLHRDPGLVRVELGGLNRCAVAELARRAGGEEWVGHAEALWAETGGNPFFVTELLAYAPHPAALGGGGGGTQVSSLTSALGVPPAVRDAIAHRRCRLSSVANRVLDAAAVIGPGFEVAVLEQVAGVGGDAVLDALDEAAAARFVAETDDAGAAYRFVAPMVRDVVYHSLGAARRARLHAATARALERLASPGAPSEVMALAHHLVKAGPAASAGRARDAVVRAGDVALDHLSYENAAGFYQHALGLGLDDPAVAGRRCRVLMCLAHARRKAGQVGAAREAYLEAIRLARALGDAEALATCAMGLAAGGRGVSAWVADEVRVVLLEEALAAVPAERPDLRARVEAELAKALYFSDDHERAHALAQEALALARGEGDEGALAEALSAARVLRWGPSNTELRLAYAEELVSLGQVAHDAEVEVRARLGRLADLLEMGEQAVAAADVVQAMALADRLGQPYYRWRTRAWAATLALLKGRMAEAERVSEEALGVWGGEPHPDALACDVVRGAVIALREGRAAEAASVEEVAEAYPMVPAYRCLAALMHAAAGERAEAWTTFERFAADGFICPPPDTQWLFGVAALAETCALLGEAAPAPALAELLAPYSGRLSVLDAFGGGGAVGGPVAHALGLLAVTLGRPVEARRCFAQAADVARRAGALSWAAKARAASAGVLVPASG